MIHDLSSSPLSDLNLPGISWTALRKSEASANRIEKDREESLEIGDSTFGVEGIILADMFAGIGTASASGAN
jgi:hypothetical protein